MSVVKYLKKQFIIALIYLIIFWIIGIGIYFIFVKPILPNCYDGIQNHGEDGVDCGGPCLPCAWQLQKKLEVVSAKAIKTQENYFDLVAKIENPNRNFGAKSFSYVFNLYDFDNNLILSREGSSFILPQQTKYVIEQKIPIGSEIYDTEFKVLNVRWQELSGYEEPELIIRNQNFEQSESFSRVTATLENRSNYDFNTIDIYAILFDKNSEILAAGKTEAETILSKENRYFEIAWFFPINDQVDKADVFAETNVFLDENFMRRYGGQREKFQEY